MLHTQTVEPHTFSLLKRLMTLPSLQSFSLVGGTALSLRYGHRSSIDLDLFYHEKFDYTQVIEVLEATFHDKFVYKQQHSQFGIFCFIDNIKLQTQSNKPLPEGSGQTRGSWVNESLIIQFFK